MSDETTLKPWTIFFYQIKGAENMNLSLDS